MPLTTRTESKARNKRTASEANDNGNAPKHVERDSDSHSAALPESARFYTRKLTALPSDADNALQERLPSLVTTGCVPREIFMISAEGATLQTTVGPMIDLCSQTQNCILGQNDWWIKFQQVRFILSSAPQYDTIRLAHPLYNHYAERLVTLFKAEGFKDPVINHRQCNGSDAVELAVHAAVEYARRNGLTQKRMLVSFDGSYHGQNLVAATASEYQSEPFLHINTGETERLACPRYEAGTQKLNQETLAALRHIEENGDNIAAVLIEPAQVRNGVHNCPIEFLRELRRICTEKDICLIFDECQTGFGWYGSLSFSGSHGVTPDIAAFSKAVTAGYGALAVMVAESKYKYLSPTLCSKSNSSYLPTIAAANAVLDRLVGKVADEEIPAQATAQQREALSTGLMSCVPAQSVRLESFLQQLKAKFPSIIGEIRGEHMIRGLEITDEDGTPSEPLCKWVVNQGFENGVYFRQADCCIIFKPPLVITREEYSMAFKNLQKTFSEGLAYLRECKAEQKELTTPVYHR